MSDVTCIFLSLLQNIHQVTQLQGVEGPPEHVELYTKFLEFYILMHEVTEN